ncbi:MAG: excinuclease ABC subunit C [Deltaproteobacteria bacterium HGW-Deltaproteobacteria-2]|jgi:excinuclease ABC subunit C|nr:MAG: excinuclease ABC subunit C [Deltaproteobacteria bacterium HGW-Deltaproteobacteria-2]
MSENIVLKEKMTSAPRFPGVYIMRDAQGKIIYVGKANDLKSRISSYFTGKDTRPMAPFLMARVHDIDFITTSTEKEALIFENNLIKRHRPRYNVTFRDDKTYYHLLLDPAERFPRLQLVRKRLKDAALYFGPYPSGLAAKETLRFVQQVFPLRSCRNRDFKLRPRPCLEYQMGRCLAPCKGLVDEKSYRKLVESVVAFLQGRRRELISELKKQMNEASQDLNYEEAACLRDRIAFLEQVLEKQNVDWGVEKDQDIVGLYEQDDNYQICILFVREGKLLGSKSFIPIKVKTDTVEVVSSCLIQYYDSDVGIPDEIIIPCRLPDEQVIIEWLTEKKNRKVTLTVPSIGTKNALLDMASDNARNLWEAAHKSRQQKTAALQILQEKLSLSKLPRRMECYDISNISGKHAVGSMVVFQDGEPDKNSYRRYRIKTLSEPDDYTMMYEVLSRRFASRENLPDFVVVDGGKGQLNVALLVLKDLKIKIDVIGLAKEERATPSGKGVLKKKAGKSEDRVYLPGRKDAVFLSTWPQALRVLQQVRDEAHRFALSYHHQVKRKNDLLSILDNIPDVGEERKKALLKHFGSGKQVKESSLDELQKVQGIGKELAEKIYNALNK